MEIHSLDVGSVFIDVMDFKVLTMRELILSK